MNYPPNTPIRDIVEHHTTLIQNLTQNLYILEQGLQDALNLNYHQETHHPECETCLNQEGLPQ